MSRVLIPLNEKLQKLKKAYFEDNEEEQWKILEDLEDEYHVDLTTFYGEDLEVLEILICILLSCPLSRRYLYHLFLMHLF